MQNFTRRKKLELSNQSKKCRHNSSSYSTLHFTYTLQLGNLKLTIQTLKDTRKGLRVSSTHTTTCRLAALSGVTGFNSFFLHETSGFIPLQGHDKH